MPWLHPILAPTLTSLTVRSPEEHDGTPIDGVINALRNLQSLQRLELSRVGSLMVEPDGSLPRSGRQVTLPKLTRLHLTHETSTCAYTLRQLVFPSNATVELYVESGTPTIPADLISLAPVVFDKLSGNGTIGTRLPILSAGLWQRGRSDTYSQLCCWRQEYKNGLPNVPDQADFSVSFEAGPSAMRTILSHFGSMVPGEDILSLRVHIDPTFSELLHWHNALVAMPNIKVLEIAKPHPDHLIEILFVPPLNEAEEDNDFMHLRNLTTLKVSDLRFPYSDQGNYMGQLTSSLEARREHGHGLRNMELKLCLNFEHSEFEALKNVVGWVTWDHIPVVDQDRPIGRGLDDDDDDSSDEDMDN